MYKAAEIIIKNYNNRTQSMDTTESSFLNKDKYYYRYRSYNPYKNQKYRNTYDDEDDNGYSNSSKRRNNSFSSQSSYNKY